MRGVTGQLFKANYTYNMAQILTMVQCKIENRLETVPIIQQDKCEEMILYLSSMWSVREQEKAQRKKLANFGKILRNFQKLSKGLQYSNIFFSYA